MRRIEIGCLCRDQIKSDAHERAQAVPRLENLDGTVGKLFSQLCSFLFVEESLIQGTSPYTGCQPSRDELLRPIFLQR